MGLDTIAEGVDRFEAYLTGLRSVIGHAGRTAPLHDYCLGLLATEGRKSVEPMASTTAPAKVSAQHQKCCTSLPIHPGQTRRCWPSRARWCCPRSSAMARSKCGSLMTRASPNRASTLWG